MTTPLSPGDERELYANPTYQVPQGPPVRRRPVADGPGSEAPADPDDERKIDPDADS